MKPKGKRSSSEELPLTYESLGTVYTAAPAFSPLQRKSPMINFYVKRFNLKPFTLDAKWEMDRYLQEVVTEISDYTFASNFIWLSSSSGFYGIINNTFCLFVLNGGSLSMLLPPLGKKEFINDAIIQCFEVMNAVNEHDPAASKIDYVCESLLADFVNFLEPGTEIFEILQDYVVERKLVDYVYNIDDLIDLRGNAYQTKRNEINKFKKIYTGFTVEVLDPKAHREDSMGLFHRWVANRLKYMPKEDTEYFFDGISYESFALKRMFGQYKELGLLGIVLKINEVVAGFTIGERLNEQTASIIVEKTDFEILGSAQFIFREFCKTFKAEHGCSLVNVGDDMGFENLRKVKLSYRPTQLIPKYTIYQKQA